MDIEISVKRIEKAKESGKNTVNEMNVGIEDIGELANELMRIAINIEIEETKRIEINNVI